MNNSEKQRKLLLEGKIPIVVLTMAVPSIVLQLVSLIYNTVDTYYIAKIDKSAAAAVGTVFAIQAILQAIGFGCGMGISSICSRKLGEKKDEEAESYAVSGLFAAVFLALIIAVVGNVFLDPILKLIGCTDTMLEYGRGYARIILLFAPVACASNVLGNMFKSEGHLQYSMYANVTGALVNVILDPVFIFDMNMGTMGAALATSISQVIGLTILYIQIIRGKTVLKLKLGNISRRADTYKQIFTTGLPTFFRQGLSSLATALMCKQGAVYGDAAVAAVTISNKCYMLVRNIVLGLGQGGQPVAGYNYGAKLYGRTKETLYFSIKIGTVFCCISALVMYIFAGDIMWWFGEDEEVLKYGTRALHFASLALPLMAFSTFVNQFYQCLGFKKQATFLASCRQGVFFIPIILILPGIIGVTAVEIAQPLADICTFFISIPFFVRLGRDVLHE